VTFVFDRPLRETISSLEHTDT